MPKSQISNLQQLGFEPRLSQVVLIVDEKQWLAFVASAQARSSDEAIGEQRMHENQRRVTERVALSKVDASDCQRSSCAAPRAVNSSDDGKMPLRALAHSENPKKRPIEL